eukprot:scaffold18214_cov33-Attheya_sp.AAC.2
MTDNLEEAASEDPMIEDPPSITNKQSTDFALKNTANKLEKATAKKERATEKLKRREEKIARHAAQKAKKAERATGSNKMTPIEQRSDNNAPDNNAPDDTPHYKDTEPDSTSIDTQRKENIYDDNDAGTSKSTGLPKSTEIDNSNEPPKAPIDSTEVSNNDTLDGIPLEVPTASAEKIDNETDFPVDDDDEEEEDDGESTAENKEEEEEKGKEEEQLDNLDLPDEIHNAIYGDEDGESNLPTDEDEYSVLNVHTQWIFHFKNIPKSKDTDLTKLTKHQVLAIG